MYGIGHYAPTGTCVHTTYIHAYMHMHIHMHIHMHMHMHMHCRRSLSRLVVQPATSLFPVSCLYSVALYIAIWNQYRLRCSNQQASTKQVYAPASTGTSYSCTGTDG